VTELGGTSEWACECGDGFTLLKRFIECPIPLLHCRTRNTNYNLLAVARTMFGDEANTVLATEHSVKDPIDSSLRARVSDALLGTDVVWPLTYAHSRLLMKCNESVFMELRSEYSRLNEDAAARVKAALSENPMWQGKCALFYDGKLCPEVFHDATDAIMFWQRVQPTAMWHPQIPFIHSYDGTSEPAITFL
jgi:hypothetical protein